MKFLVVGAGAIGGVVGAHLARANHDVTLLARGANLDILRTRGLTIHSPAGTDVVRIPVVERAVVSADTVVLLAVKTQDAPDALRALATVAPPSTPIACMTNGIEAERLALRWFDRVYAVCANTPATYLEPGVVESRGTPFAGMFDIGCYPAGQDALCDSIAAAFESANLSSHVFADIMRWKRNKLVFNLSNALDALCGPEARKHAAAAALRDEARRVFDAANLSTLTTEEATERNGDFRTGTIDGRARSGGSTWQSLARGATVVECEFLNGEITLLGRLHGVPTPLNAAVLREVTRAAATNVRAGSLSIDDLARRVTAGV